MSHQATHDEGKVDAATGQTVRSHEWDGITELNTPLPRWWVNIFYATIIWSIGYWIVYPSWPLVNSYAKGVIGYASRQDVADELAALKALRASKAAGMDKATVEEISANPELRKFAIEQGRTAFKDNCAPVTDRKARVRWSSGRRISPMESGCSAPASMRSYRLSRTAARA